MKALLALASLVGITVKGDETEDQLTAAITAHKPAPKNVVIDFEDAEVKAAFAARITDATKDSAAKITTLEAEFAKITALLTNGAAGAAGGNAPVPGAQGGAATKTKDEQIEALQADLAASKDPKERGRIIAQIGTLRRAA